jgi:hypothetical protein
MAVLALHGPDSMMRTRVVVARIVMQMESEVR